jgi:NADH dehydrogenase
MSGPRGPALAITGASGFVGRRLLALLSPTDVSAVTCLVRTPSAVASQLGSRPGWRATAVDLGRPAAIASALAGSDTLLHLAAATGKASRARYQLVNVDGTRLLLEGARQAGIRRVIFVSSIAVTFSDRHAYHYAESKVAAEQLVRDSGLDWAIVRPTMIFGPGSAVQRGLVRLATAPVGIVFGEGAVPVQPVHVDDLAQLLIALLLTPRLDGLTLEAGGPDTILLIDLLKRMRLARRGAEGPFIEVPLEPLRSLLALLEPVLLPVLPFTAGQLASFTNAGVAPLAPRPAHLPAPVHSLAQMLTDV